MAKNKKYIKEYDEDDYDENGNYNGLYNDELQQRRAEKVLKGTKNDTEKELVAWGNHLEKELTFPFEAIVEEFQDYNIFRQGEIVTVDSIAGISYDYSVLANVTLKNRPFWKKKKRIIAIWELMVADKDSKNYQVLEDYRMWDGNVKDS